MGISESRIRVLFGDTDALGIVYYANYLRYFEVGRAEWFRSLDRPATHYIENDYFLVVIETGARFHRPARYDQVLRVQTILGEMTRARMRFDYRILDDQTGQLLTTGFTKHTVTDQNGRIRRFSQDFRDRMEKLLRNGFD